MVGNEIGRIGQKRYSGIFYEEFLRDLRGKKGIETYKEMSENDDIIGAILFSIEMLMRQTQWNVQPAGKTVKDKRAAEFVQECMFDMQDTWTDTISEILSFLTYGWSYHEIVYKRRIGRTKNPDTKSKYQDGLIGWKKLPIRAQETLYEWKYDEKDNLIALTQMPPPDLALYTIPVEKALHFRTKSRKGNPEGKSILRNAYRSWYFKKKIQEFEGIGIERDLAGLPLLIAAEGEDIWEDSQEARDNLFRLQEMVRMVRRDEKEGIVLPYGYEFKLLNSGGNRQFDTNKIIDRYDTRIAMTVLADFIILGHQQVGSFALSSDKTKLFSVAIGAYLDIITETFNSQGIPALIDMNESYFDSITDYPRLVHGDVEHEDITKVAQYVKEMTGIGILVPDEALEDHMRQLASLPERQQIFEEQETDLKEQEEKKREEAKKSLGRDVNLYDKHEFNL